MSSGRLQPLFCIGSREKATGRFIPCARWSDALFAGPIRFGFSTLMFVLALFVVVFMPKGPPRLAPPRPS